MNDNSIKKYIERVKNEYVSFMGIDSMPHYELIVKELSLELSKKQGFDSLGVAHYDTLTGKHTLEICTLVTELNADYIIFHELTHICDAQKYSTKGKVSYMSNKGYTEYHASQIALLKLLKVDNIQNNNISFSINDTINTITGTQTISQYIKTPHSNATEIISRSDFPKNIEALSTALGLIFNYYGNRSICKMYACDYVDSADNTYISKLINENNVKFLNSFMLGWFDDNRVGMIDQLFYRMVISLVQQYKLQ